MGDDHRGWFAELFRGRTDAYGIGDGRGGCDKSPESLGSMGQYDEYERRITAHLAGSTTMGVYPLTDDLQVGWGCTDLDGGEADYSKAVDIRTLMAAAGVTAHVERSRSKGYHVWVFADSFVPAEVMRNALLAVHQMLDIPPTEVNPKQTSLDGLKGYGNYVRLPYPGVMSTGTPDRQVMLDQDGNPMDWPTWVDFARANRTSPATLGALADLWIPPPPPKRVYVAPESTADLEALARQLSKDAYLAWKYGPREGHDRSSSMMRLAHMCREDGLAPADALRLVTDLDDRLLGKFTDRADGPDQIERMILRAYQQ